MKERPILFSVPMVRAILDGAKTVTRRLVANETKACPECFAAAVPHNGTAAVFGGDCYLRVRSCEHKGDMGGGRIRYRTMVGDRLWVKETHATIPLLEGAIVAYRATCPGDAFDFAHGDGSLSRIRVDKWRPSIFMRREWSRLTLEVVSVRVERLQDITEPDAIAEGVREGSIPADEDGPRRIGYVLGDDDGKCVLYPTPQEAFAVGWDGINADRAAWSSNPWVWVLGFRRLA